jgi:DNA repair exonuclease SbcCD ATPase subunit
MTGTNPFIKVTWEDVPENFTHEKIKRVKTYFQQKYNTKHVQILTKSVNDIKLTKLSSLDVSDSILDEQYQKNLMKDFIKENNIGTSWELLDRLDNKVNAEIKKTNQNKVKYNKWYIKRIEFSNFLSYGNNNVIDFNGLNGISVIESTPKNFGGKSTISVDLLMFLFFSSTTKTKTNADIFNKFTDEDEVSVKGEITIDGEDYFIERKIIRKKSKSNDYTVTNKLEFYKRKNDGSFENLTGEQRRETEAFISSAIGSEEDFLATILTTGNNLEDLIESKPTARGQILTKFLGLENLKVKEDIAKEMYNEWSKKLVSNTHNITQLNLDNDNLGKEITNCEEEIIRLNNSLNSLELSLNESENRKEEILLKRNNDIDQNLIRINPDLLGKEISDLKNKQTQVKNNVDSIVVKEPSEYYLEEEHQKLQKEITNLIVDDKLLSDAITRNEKLIKQYQDSSICPVCKRSLDDVDHTSEINNLKEDIENLKLKKENGLSLQNELNEKEKNYQKLKTEYENYEKEKIRKSRYELEFEQMQLDISKKEDLLGEYYKNQKKLEDNKLIDSELISLKTKIESIKGDIKLTNINIEKNSNNIKTNNEKIQINNELIKKIKTEEEFIGTYKSYLTIYGKNGIPKVILKNMIPLLNLELYKLLVDSCHFILELNINDKNEVEFIMIDTETRVTKSLSSGSGYERTVSSLALRCVLTKISSLPKPNIVVMDEVFGKIADENLEMVGEFFKKIKSYFEHIFVISHNPLIRNWCDNLIMVKKESNVSSIDFITTKIS